MVVGGTAFAAGQITGKQVKDSSLTGKDVKDKSLSKSDFKGSLAGAQGAQGPQGPQGPQGVQGPAGATGPAGAVSGAAGGSLTGTYPNPGIAGGAVGSGQLAPNAIPADGTGNDGSTKLATNSVDFDEVGIGAVHGVNFKKQGTFNHDFSSIAPNSCDQYSQTLGGGTAADVDGDDVVMITASSALVGNQFIPTAIAATTTGQIRVQLCNPRVTASDPPDTAFAYVVIER